MKKGLLVLAVVLASSVVFAQEAAPLSSAAKDLSAGFGTSVIDTLTLPAGKLELGAAAGYVTNSEVFETGLISVTYGIIDGLQANANWPLVLGEGHLDGNGDTNLGLLWEAVKDDGSTPALGLQLSGRIPTGYGFTGYNGTLTGVITKSFGEFRLLGNAGVTTIGKNGDDGRNHTDSFKIGADYMVLDNIDVIVDLSSDMASVQGADRIEALEIGMRYAMTDVDVLSAGIAVGIGNGNATPDFMGTVGYQRCF